MPFGDEQDADVLEVWHAPLRSLTLGVAADQPALQGALQRLVLDAYLVIVGSAAYWIECTALESDYDEFKPKFAEIVATFSLNK